MEIVKRSGEVVLFDSEKILNAIKKALTSSQESTDVLTDAQRICQDVISGLEDKTYTVEEIQDKVETSLMDNHFYKTAKCYILYRDEHNKIRLQNRITQEFQLLANNCSEYFNHDPLREFVFSRTYAKWIPQKERRELWSETVDRYINFIKSKCGDKLETGNYSRIQEALLNMEVMPSMRLLQFAGAAAERCNVCVYNCSFSAPESFKDLADIMYLSMSGTGVGFSVEKYNVNKFPEFSIPPESPTHKIYTIEDSKQGWCDSLIECLIAEFGGNEITFDYSKLRPKGARLMTSGGRSSGPDPLRELHQFIHETIKTRRESGNSRLSTLNVHDIICKIGQIVVAGGVRRSALISISDLDDQEMRDCKNGPIWLNNSQRYLSNNSAAYNVKPSQIQFMKEWIALAESGTGERGIVNRSGLKRVLPKRRVDFLGDKINHVGMNPCVTADTPIMTVDGFKPVSELIGKKSKLLVDNQEVETTDYGFFKKGRELVYEVVTKRGKSIKCSSSHKLHVLTCNTPALEWTELKNIKVGDKIRITSSNNFCNYDNIKSITLLDEQDVYDCTINHPDIHWYDSNGIISHNCSEIILQPFQFCNLTEVVCRSDDTKESLFRKVSIATVMGTIQSSLSDFKYIEDKWKKNQDDERLLGVSFTGIMDCPALNEPGILEYLKNQCIACNQEYADFLGINPSNAITCVKPSGSVSQMVNSSSGIHPRFAPYYIRRVRISDDDPLLKMMKAQGYQTHRAPEAANTSVLEFPVKSPDNAITVNDTDTIQQLETWKRFKKNWTEHNPSVTIYVKPDEWLETGKWVWDNWDDVLGISFFPKSEHVYEMAPYEAITKEEYESRLKSLKKVNFAELVNFELEDATEVKKEVACAGGVCEL